MGSYLLIPFLWIPLASDLHVYLTCPLSSMYNVLFSVWTSVTPLRVSRPFRLLWAELSQVPSLREHFRIWWVRASCEDHLQGWAMTSTGLSPVPIPRSTTNRGHATNGQITAQLQSDFQRWGLLTWWFSLWTVSWNKAQPLGILWSRLLVSLFSSWVSFLGSNTVWSQNPLFSYSGWCQ